jgi:hypothetical protein
MAEPEEKVPVEEESNGVVVVDPEDYQRTQKLKAIQEAKDYYKSFTFEESKKYHKLSETWSNPKEALYYQEAEALSLYVSELIPLIEKGIEQGGLSEQDLQVELAGWTLVVLSSETMDIRDVVEHQGTIHGENETRPLPDRMQMRVYRQLERIEAKLGLGLDLEIDKGPAEI